MPPQENQSVGNDEYQIVDSATPAVWKQWGELCETEGWASIDHSVRHTLPRLPNVRCVFAVRKSDEAVLGFVVWSESQPENIVYISTYVVVPGMQGKGIGSAVWKRAIHRIQADGYNIVLAAVMNMVDKYAAHDTPIIDRPLLGFRVGVDRAVGLLSAHQQKHDHTLMRVRDLSPAQFEQLLRFDRASCGRDRSELLRMHWKLDCVEGYVLFSPSGEIVSLSGVCSTGLPEKHLFRVGPVYAASLALATATLVPLLECVRDKDAEAVAVITIVGDTKGDQLLSPILSEKGASPPSPIAILEFARPFTPTSDGHNIVVMHFHTGYLDM